MAKRKRASAPTKPSCSSRRNRQFSRRHFLVAGAYVLAGAVHAGAPDVAPSPSPHYSLVPGPRTPADLRKQCTGAQIALLEKLNRRDADHLLRAEPAIPGVVVTDLWLETA